MHVPVAAGKSYGSANHTRPWNVQALIEISCRWLDRNPNMRQAAMRVVQNFDGHQSAVVGNAFELAPITEADALGLASFDQCALFEFGECLN